MMMDFIVVSKKQPSMNQLAIFRFHHHIFKSYGIFGSSFLLLVLAIFRVFSW